MTLGVFVIPESIEQAFSQMPQAATIPIALKTRVVLAIFVVLVVMLVLLPACLIWFYGRRDVAATCALRHTQR